ncbi:TetR/AcrR family transcriptional regulator [Microbacterium flavum]|uniref:TetR/AcrR family transcriptional regulator n=1 Tax=Microbacterium flavum TaxID=415216 RepID=UPI0024ADE7CF|nr:TetR/AcrR family transcriptional regulator [Microbacterium flavum]
MEAAAPRTEPATARAGQTGTADAILDAALAETLAHGIRRTSIADIARRSGVSRQTIYRYWPDAQSVFASLVTREVIAQIPADAADPGPASSLDGLVAVLVDAADRVRRLEIVDRLRETDPELFARYILGRLGTSQRHVHAALAAHVRRGQTAGTVRAGDADQRAAMLLLVLQSAVQSAPLVAEWLDEDGWRRELSGAVRGMLQRSDAGSP